MPVDRLPNLPGGADVFLDANVFIYTFGRQSIDCRDLLRRCANEEVFGITTLDVINEVTHRLMLTEAVAKGVITKGNASALKGRWRDVVKLTEYWTLTSRIFGLNILLVSSDEPRLHRAQTVRSNHGLLTNDSLILATMVEYANRS
jgi:predicted nucleic acid-binding protein